MESACRAQSIVHELMTRGIGGHQRTGDFKREVETVIPDWNASPIRLREMELDESPDCAVLLRRRTFESNESLEAAALC